jgi:hypothetical protein
MDSRLICQWLGLPAAAWPPDHYTLLGLPPGEADTARIEQHAWQRLERVRCYQISHPEQATEAMNRLAQALVCLTDRAVKQRYDAMLGLAPNGAAARLAPAVAVAPAPSSAALATAAMDETAIQPPQTRVDWATTPPPIRVAVPAQAPPLPESAPPSTSALAAAEPVTPRASPTAPQVPVAEPVDPFPQAARASPAARRGLGTRRALYERFLASRTLLRLWDQAGKYVGRPKRRLARPAEGTELTRKLAKLDQLLTDFPPLLGQAGQPGYRVIMLGRDENVPLHFQALSPAEREVLALDWKTGRAVLAAHLEYVRKQVRRLRRQGWLQRAARAVRGWVNDHPGWVVLGVVIAFLMAALSAWSLH